MATTPTPPSSPGRSTLSADQPNLDTVKSDATNALDELKDVASNVGAEVSDQARGIADEAKSQLSQAADQAKTVAGDQKDKIAEQVGSVAKAIGSAASELEAKNGAASQYARMLADKTEQFSETIRNNDVDALLGMANDFGRKQPVAFLGMAALLGFAASRFLVASANRPASTAKSDLPTTDDASPTPKMPSADYQPIGEL
jgi:ElaB/YqjD/DUF883 family membrane-anchored ribosome-binding protein